MKKTIKNIPVFTGLIIFILMFAALSCPVKAGENTGDLKRLSGEKWIPDKDAFVFMILGDGFTESEQSLFYEKAGETAENILNTEPYSEYRDIFKFYGLGCISAESGAVGDAAESVEEAAKDRRDTFFGSYFYSGGTDRLLTMDKDQEEKALLIAKQYVPEVDFVIVLVNSGRYGGSGGEICMASLHEDSGEIVLHELGHTIAGLEDEYWPGIDEIEAAPNVSQTGDPGRVAWEDLLGEEGVGIYPYEDGEEGWYKPSENCKMQYLGKEYDFCPVCQRALKEAFTKYANESRIYMMEKTRTFILPGAIAILMVIFTVICCIKRKNPVKGHETK